MRLQPLKAAAVLALLLAVAARAAANPLLDIEFWRTATEAEVAAALDRGADLSARDEYGETLLHWAAAFSKTPAGVALLLDRGAEVNARNNAGFTPLHRVAWSTTPAMVALLLDRGADLSARDKDGETPLHRAAFSKTPAVVALPPPTSSSRSCRNWATSGNSPTSAISNPASPA